jgi:hypothetical protein
MNILLWYLPYAMFSGACDVVLSESERSRSNESRTATTSCGGAFLAAQCGSHDTIGARP